MSDVFKELLGPKMRDFEVWMLVAQAANAKHNEEGAGSLNEVQRVVFRVWAASGVIGNRGFYGHSLEELRDWAAAYRSIGAEETARTIEEAAAVIPTIDFEVGDADREQKLVGPIEERYYALDRDTERFVVEFIRCNTDAALANLGPFIPAVRTRIEDSRRHREESQKRIRELRREA